MMEISRHTMRRRLISSESLIVVRNDGHPSGNVVVGRSSSSQCPSVSEGVLVANPLTIPTGNCGLATMSVCYMCVKWSFYRPLSYHAVREKAMKCGVKTYIILRLMLFNPITFILSIFLLGRGWSTAEMQVVFYWQDGTKRVYRKCANYFQYRIYAQYSCHWCTLVIYGPSWIRFN